LALIAAVAALSGIAAQPAAAADPVNCTREKDPPAPPKGGAVFARPLQAAPHPTNPNVVVIPAGATWTPTGSCPSADWVMNHPSSIEVGEDGAVLLRGQRAIDFDRSNSVYSGAVAWGARDDKSSPDLDGVNDRLKWRRTTEALSVDPKRLLKDFNSCRDCDLAGVDAEADVGVPGTLTIVVVVVVECSCS